MNNRFHKIKTTGFIALIFLFVAMTIPSCAPKSGCPATVSLQQRNAKASEGTVKKNKKKGKSNLFPKDVKKNARIRDKE